MARKQTCWVCGKPLKETDKMDDICNGCYRSMMGDFIHDKRKSMRED